MDEVIEQLKKQEKEVEEQKEESFAPEEQVEI